MSELRRTLVALGVLAVLVLAWFLTTLPGAPTDDSALVVVAVDPARLTTVQIRNAFGSWDLARAAGGDWRVGLGTGEGQDGDGAAVAAFLSALRRLEALRTVPAGTLDDDAAGLTSPAATVTWTGPGVDGTLDVGAPNRLAGTAYVRRRGRPDLMLVPLPRVAGFLASPQALRDRTVARIPVDRLRSLTIRHDQTARRFVRLDDGTAVLETAGATLPVYPPALSELCETLSALRAEGFVSSAASEASLGLAPPRIRVEAVFDPPLPPLGLSVGNRAADDQLMCVLRRDDAPGVVLVAADLLSALSADDDEFRDRSPFSIAGEAPTWIRLDSEGVDARELELLLRGDRWDVSVPARPTVDTRPLLTLLQSARAVQYRRFPDEDQAAYGLDEPVFRLSLAAHNDASKVFVVGISPSGRAWVLTPDQAVAEIPRLVAEQFRDFLRSTGRPRTDG